MKIKKVELSGFKSFVDRTVLHFDHDVLGVVGPNGCGKSNIVDAIRWCMGEQSARHLRGRLMDDVIFSGSDSRKPNDFAEVTLTFDNDSPNDVPLEYRDYAEIAVTRRLHRTGESEYLVNKTAVRLRDVTDLFLGTGAGTKAYSIVEQGKVGLIVSAKPEERRLLIEEAAGITRFKSRKKQAERKMELTQQNLLRVGDIVTEIDRSLASLKRQAAKAERYVAYRQELEDLQLHDASHRYLELAGYIKLEAGQVESVAEATEQIRQELEESDARVGEVRAEVHVAEQSLEAARQALFATETAVAGQQASIARAKDRLGVLEQRKHEMESEKRDMTTQLDQLDDERRRTVVEIAAGAEAEASQLAEMAERDAARADADRSHANAEARVVDSRHQLSSAKAEVAGAQAKLGGIDRRLGEMSARGGKLQAERQALSDRRSALDTHASDLARCLDEERAAAAHAASEKARLETRIKDMNEERKAREIELDEQKASLAGMRSRFSALEELRSRFEGVGAGAKALMQKRDERVLGLLADRIEVPAELIPALAGLLGPNLQSVVVRDTDAGIELLDDLARKAQGRATVVPVRTAYTAGQGALEKAGEGTRRLIDLLEFASEDEGLVRSLVGEAVVVNDIAIGLELRAAGVRADFVTTAGTVLRSDGSIEGGKGEELWAGMLENKREARELAVAIARRTENVDSLRQSLESCRGEIASVGRALDQARQDAHARELSLLAMEKDLQKTSDQLEGIAGRLSTLETEEADLVVATDEARVERDGVAKSLESTSERVAETERTLEEADRALGEARTLRDRERELLLAGKVHLAAIAERIAAARAIDTRLERSVRELQARLARIEDEIVSSATGYDETTAQLAGHEAALGDCATQAARAREDLEAVRVRADELRARLAASEAELKQRRQRGDLLRDELQTHEMTLREKQLALEHLLSAIADKFRGLRLATVVGDYHMRTCPDEVSRARIDELSRLVERMGTVNLDATRELAEAEERFTFYSTQKIDLEKALADLQRAVQQMNRESRRLFEETFEAVNARFKEIFPRMFRGGRAELRMTNPDDLLETGLDIIAQPPGKKLSSIELMSGGEKALTAVSLIFAIFQIKPSPFCILDEVDAPLDDANVGRYNEMIRSMTERSQFILITHHKRTMQSVDVLYGVTMPEAGVSKIVSVKINDSLRRTSAAPVEVAVA
jgi:chromosome segregation protein